MNRNILLTGGIYKKSAAVEEVGRRFDAGYLQIVDWNKRKIEREMIYRSPADCIGDGFGTVFKAGDIDGEGLIILPTSTEVLLLSMEGWQIVRRLSNPGFNDIHHAKKVGDKIYVVNTGMEQIDIIDQYGELLESIELASEKRRKQFSSDVDYRFLHTTKPHEIHANHLFFLEDEPWVTRFKQRDAVLLIDPERRINLDVSQGVPSHDGHVRGDFIYFTLTDGYIAVVSRETLVVEAIFDLNKMSGRRSQLGWCRGVDIAGTRAWVGFSQFRTSKFREYGQWIRAGEKPQLARVARVRS